MTEQEKKDFKDFMMESGKAHFQAIDAIVALRRDLEAAMTIIKALATEVSRLKGSKIIINGGGPKAEA